MQSGQKWPALRMLLVANALGVNVYRLLREVCRSFFENVLHFRHKIPILCQTFETYPNIAGRCLREPAQPRPFEVTRPRTIKNIDRNALFGTVKIPVNGIFILFNSVLFFELTYVLRKGYSTSRKKQWFEHDWNDRASRNIVPKLKTFVLWFNWECCQRNIASTVLFDSVAFRECRWWHIALPL